MQRTQARTITVGEEKILSDVLVLLHQLPQPLNFYTSSMGELRRKLYGIPGKGHYPRTIRTSKG